jgi:hypothetical protein
MEYAINTSAEVVHASGRYYAVQHGVWFVADSPLGPWAVADMIPAEIYTIPPSCPLYHLRYVYVYGATPDYVYVGYTPGYMGAFISDVVVSGVVRPLPPVLLLWLAVDLGIRIPVQLLGWRLVLAAWRPLLVVSHHAGLPPCLL